MGEVDVIMELRRLDPRNKKDRRRLITGYSRYDVTPEELVIELAEDGTGYVALGDRGVANEVTRRLTIATLLPAEGDGLTATEVHTKWPGEPRPGERTVATDLNAGFEKQYWARTGEGKKGSPYRFRKAVAAPP